MTLMLSSRDQRQLAEAFRALASPLAYPTTAEWRVDAHRSLSALIGADTVSSSFVASGEPLAFSEQISAEVLSGWLERTPPQPTGGSTWQRAASLGAFTREMVWHGHLREYCRTEYYNDYILGVYRCYRHAGLGFRRKAGEGPEAAPQLALGRNDRTADPFSDHDVALLRLLQPAFVSGVETCIRLGATWATLATTMDQLEEGVLICGAGGAVVHVNAALQRLLDEDPEGEQLFARVHQVARMLASSPAPLGMGRSSTPIRTGTRSYRVAGSYLAEDALPSHRPVVVTVACEQQDRLASIDLQERFGLTRKEAAVARLLAKGLSNDAIATELSISPHTARRHTEKVLKKLSVATRAAVGPALLGVATEARRSLSSGRRV